MKLKGVCYDVGSVMGGSWRPDYFPETVRIELGIIQSDLHCNAVHITGQDIGRVIRTAEDALSQGLEVGLSPLLWNRSQNDTIEYTMKPASARRTLQLSVLLLLWATLTTSRNSFISCPFSGRSSGQG